MSTKTTLINKAKRIHDGIFVDKVITPENEDAVQSVVKAPGSSLADEFPDSSKASRAM